MVSRRRFLVSLPIAALGASTAWAQGYPVKAIRLIVPNAAGGGLDFMARTTSAVVSQGLGQTLVIDNKPGAATILGASEAARSAPDGYTLLIADSGTLVFNPLMYSKLPYDPARDFVPVSLLGRFPMILVVGPSVQQDTAAEFIEFMKSHPSAYTYGSPGVGNPLHLSMELVKKTAGFHMLHIPYRGAAPAIQDVAAGQVSGMMIDLAAGAGMLKAGRVRPLAVAHQQRLAQLPNVPTFRELGIGDITAAAMVGIAVPARTPSDIVERLEQQFIRAVNDSQVRAKLIEFGVEPVGSTSSQYIDSLADEKLKWEPLISDLKIKLAV